MVINELIITERDYVRDMQSVLDVGFWKTYHWFRSLSFIFSFAQGYYDKIEGLNEYERDILFGNLPQIVNVC